jgi:glycosyltransferase involved in cell wall biosynthesis
MSPGEGRLTQTVEQAGGDVTIVPQHGRLDRYGGTVLSSGLVDRVGVIATLISYNFRVLRALNANRPDAILCLNVRSMLMIGLAARLLRIPSVLYVKSPRRNPMLDRIAGALAGRILFSADALMNGKRRSKFGRLPIGYDLSDAEAAVAARPEGRDAEDEREHLTFSCCSSLLPANGIHVLIDAFERTIHHVSDIRLSIIGDSDDADYIQELRNVVDWQRLGARVAFHGWQENPVALIEDTDIFVQPAFEGGHSYPVVAAMALGKPVISTVAGGAPELLGQGEYGMLVPANDSVLLSDAMYRMSADRAVRADFGAAAAAAVRKNHSIEGHIAALEQALDSVAGPAVASAPTEEIGATAH